ncbi:Tryptophan--tRNA ligase [Fusobacterium sp. DD29]|uniref:tryptophan--tRNA ligase n=1 Tax=unclassified Fusobacterium TaxID=2648384 RepID=UPI001B8BAE65|nr:MULTISPECIES: tryptophan--tRNA ligase [unclassified Fusobacterium]MBR8700287.1 Tryptophan--tRNA ligase [Fusobacterium sp. DD45]MBR8709980.1 Tryptophan--tRNA ligase [Fusobacterium sp. DD28]MBR8748417.1 Tryptophan--tRNA ligase [Fusobacterium sp. DD29]MBR8750620.1 Tryptophan--tRNA ligase [Fusobacterium sp. DD26]MBR8760684.1 Tryptophan--tRNA ligase [Fusobacterium sp. DD25]
MKRSLSGIQSSGILHLGNYFGAIKQFVDNQKSGEYDCFYFIADYHSLTSLPDPKSVTENTYNIVLDYLALGLDPKKSTIFLQSDVPEHTELSWLLSNVTPVGLLERGHSYKDKIAKGISPNTGLLTYPVLMAADILMYDTDIVPVGKDQKQHLEFARDIAMKFNQQYGVDLFKLPEPLILDDSAIVPGTDGQKMSKSYGNTINMFASKKELKKQVMSIVTDSTPLEEPKDPDNNVAKLYALFATIEKQNEMKEKFLAGNYGYGHAKTEVLNAILEYFGEAREKREELIKHPDYIKDVLFEGGKKARAIAQEKVMKAKEAVGLVGNLYKYMK